MNTSPSRRSSAELENVHPRSGSTAGVASAAALRDEHAHLERVYEALANAYRSDDWAVVREQWNVFEEALRRHMAFEEEHVFPAFREADLVETDELLAEHARLRSDLETLGLNVELHCVPERDVEALLARLRAHAAREDVSLYPWIAARPSPTT